MLEQIIDQARVHSERYSKFNNLDPRIHSSYMLNLGQTDTGMIIREEIPADHPYFASVSFARTLELFDVNQPNVAVGLVNWVYTAALQDLELAANAVELSNMVSFIRLIEIAFSALLVRPTLQNPQLY